VDSAIFALSLLVGALGSTGFIGCRLVNPNYSWPHRLQAQMTAGANEKDVKLILMAWN
jgi:Tfp pilus assembly protein PilW